MAELIFPLLGVVNQGATEVAVRQKYVIRVTAEQLGPLLQYERKGTQKAAPFRITPASMIRLDKKIQRGTDDSGYLQQQPSKIVDIAKTLLGDSAAAMRYAYLGSLVWNVRRPAGSLEINELQRPPMANGAIRPPEFRLRIEADAIYLTDSAHRHFGIVEALRMWKTKPDAYPRFSPKIEFTIEIYNLDLQGEHELFYELNGKQKKASPAKLKELDTSSPIGALRNAVLGYDASDRRFLENNIEVTAVQNKHTLMTMSVFVSTIAEMFTTAEIREAREEEDSRQEFAEYYCHYLYKLADTIVVKCDIEGNGKEIDVHPFRNLHATFIKDAIDKIQPEAPEESQKRIAEASEKANKHYERLRAVDIANNNATVRALFRIGGIIREMDQWETVIDRLQTDLVVPANGKFFQRENPDWFNAENDVPIASLNLDSSINIQVQSKTINKIYSYLREHLGLNHPALLSTHIDGSSRLLSENEEVLWTIHQDTDNIKSFELRFVAPRSTQGYEDNLKLSIDSEEWKQANFKGSSRLQPTSVQEDKSYQHPSYPDLSRYTAYFELKLPPATKDAHLTLTFSYPDFDRTELKKKTAIGAKLQ
jgi:hypothetical protein